MVSDERLEKIEQLVSDSLNEESVLQKVSTRHCVAALRLTPARVAWELLMPRFMRSGSVP